MRASDLRVICLACWLFKQSGYTKKIHTGYGPYCPR